MIDRRSDIETRELPDRRKNVLSVSLERRSGIKKRSGKDRRVAKARRVFWDKRSPVMRRKNKDKRNIGISEILDKKVPTIRRSGYRQTISTPIISIQRVTKDRRVTIDRRTNKRRQKLK